MGSRTIARPSATRWRWPPESWAGFRSSTGSRPSARAASSTRSVDRVPRGAPHPEPEAEVLPHRHVGVERVGLEDHRDVALLRRERGHVPIADQDRGPPVGRLQPGDHSERGALAAAGRSHQHHEFAVVDLEIESLGGHVPVGVGLLDAFETNRCHGYPFTAPAVSPCTIRRWNASTSSVTGAVATTAAARICPQGT